MMSSRWRPKRAVSVKVRWLNAWLSKGSKRGAERQLSIWTLNSRLQNGV